MNNRGRAVVILFRGDPRREERQKRLPRRFLSAIHDALLKTIGGLPGVDVLIARDAGGEFLLGDGRWQISSLAARIETAIAHGFSCGYSRVLLLAGDVVDLRREHIAEGLRTIDGSARRAVIGCSGDGGFYVVGFNWLPEVDWSHLLHDPAHAGAALSDALRAEGFALTTIPSVDDIDGRVDAERLLRLRRASRALLRLIAGLASRLVRISPVSPFSHPKPEAALAFSSPLRGPPGYRCLL